MKLSEYIDNFKVGDRVNYKKGFYEGKGTIVFIKEKPTFNNAPYLLITDERIEKKEYVPDIIKKEYGGNRNYSWFTQQSLKEEIKWN